MKTTEDLTSEKMNELDVLINDKTLLIEVLQMKMNAYIKKIEADQRELGKQINVLRIRKSMEAKPKNKEGESTYKPVYF